MPGQDGARIDARALLSSPDRSVLRSKAAQSSILAPLIFFLGVRSVLQRLLAALCTTLNNKLPYGVPRQVFF